MRSPLRIGARSFGLATLAIAVATVAVAGATLAQEPALLAGAARADLTPPAGAALYGYGARVGVATGVHDRLWARALVLAEPALAESDLNESGRGDATRVAIVTLDLGSLSKESTERVRERVAAEVALDQILLVASHTHSAPRADPEFPDPAAPHIHEIERRIAGAVIEAAAALQPASVAAGRGELTGCHNRRRVREDGSVEMLWENRSGAPTEPIDRRVDVVAVTAADGEAIATLVGFACHPVVLGPENLEVSADYPGAMAERVESELGGVAMFLPGAAGDINPNWDKTPPAQGGFEQAALLGRRLGDEALRVVAGLRAAPPGETGVQLDVRVQRIELEPRWDLDDPAVRSVFERRGQERLFAYYRDRFRAERIAEITTLTVTPRLALAFFPGEFFVEHGLRLRAQSPIESTLFVGYTNGELGYFPTLRAAAEGGYGADQATVVAVGAGERLVDRAAIALLEQSGRLGALPTP